MKKLFFIMLVCSCLLCGCTVKYDRKDIAEYIETEYGLTDFSVNRRVDKVKDEEGYRDRLWTVEDHEHNVTFHVLDDFGAGKMGTFNYLWDDYGSARLEAAFDNYAPESIELDVNTDLAGMHTSRITGRFSSRDELEAYLTETQTFLKDYLNNEVEIRFFFYMDTPYRDAVEEDDLMEGDYFEDSKELTDEMYQEAMEQFIAVSVDYGLDSYLADFTNEEITEAIKENSYRIGISDTKDGEYEYYEDLCANQYGYGVSFSTLYQILDREGYPVEGDKNHYSFVGVDGATYEISYEFVGYEYEDGQIGYYYLKDGEQTPMLAYFYNHFFANDIAEMTGFYVKY